MYREYNYKDNGDFSGLIPKANAKIGMVIGNELEVVDINALANSEVGPVRPPVTPNTEEQEEVNNEMISGVTDTSTTSTYSARTESINNLTMPSDSNRAASISGNVQNGATFVNESTGKSLTIANESEEPVNVTVITNGGNVNLKGEYNDIYLSGKGLPSGNYPNVHGTVTIEDTDQPVSVSLNFVGDECGVTYFGDEDLTITDGVTAETASPTIYAPNATVKVGGKYDEVTATVSENTLVLNGNFHANKLTILKGNVFVNGLDINDFVDEFVAHEGCVVTYAEFHVSQDNYSKLFSSSVANGKIILDTDIDVARGRQLGVLASGKELIDLNGHTLRCGDTRPEASNTGSLYMRGSAVIDIVDSVGGGKFINNHNDYLVWENGASNVLNIYSGDFEGYVHVLYAFQGTINVYGGVFKMLGENTDRDVNGNYKFLLNCKDEHYTDGTAHINVYGGKFYEFNPSVSYSEPNGPISLVPEGYHTEESIEDGVKVFTVVKD